MLVVLDSEGKLVTKAGRKQHPTYFKAQAKATPTPAPTPALVQAAENVAAKTASVAWMVLRVLAS